MKALTKLLLFALSCVTATGSFAGDKSPKKYLFLDDRWIRSSYEVVRVIHTPERELHNPVLLADQPWEKGVNLYGSVLYDEGKYRMWYQVYNLEERDDPRFRTAVAYAESDDGLHWRKPLMGSIPHRGKPTNLVLLSHGTSDLYSPAIVKDMNATDPSKRYKMLYWDSMSKEDLDRVGANFPLGKDVPGWKAIPGEGFFVAFSPDGIHWTNANPQPSFTCACDASSLSRSADGTFSSYFKISVRDDRHFRVLGTSESKDFAAWTQPRVILEPDWRDAYGTEFYGMSVTEYFGNTVGLIWIYHNAPSDKRVNVQLATRTEDGQWRRAGDRRVFFDVGSRGEWDAGGVYPGSSLLVGPPGHENEIWMYYGASSVTHDDSRYREDAIGLAKFRLDGFAAMEAKQFLGSFETQPVHPEGSKLFLNAETIHGFAWIEVVEPITGKVIAKSKRCSGLDKTSITVEWESGLSPLSRGQEVILRFHMQRSKLFSFWFE